MCEILTPADLPVQPDQGGRTDQKSRDRGEMCTVLVQMSDAFDTITATASRRPAKFSEYVPPPNSPNGKSTEIQGRQAWIGNPTASGSDKNCGVAVGAAEGYLVINVIDETQRGADPCQTVTQVAEKVISRTPEPYGQ